MQTINNTNINISVNLIETIKNLKKSQEKYQTINFLKNEVVQYNFNNGLSILIIPTKENQEKFISWNVHCGSMYNSWTMESSKEMKVRYGVPKFLEYEMLERKIQIELSKSNNTIERNECLKILERLTKSETYKNYTTYALNANEEDFEKCLPLFLELMQKPIEVFDEKEAERYWYRKVLLEEDDDYKILFDKILKLMSKEKNIYLDKYGESYRTRFLIKQNLIDYYDSFYTLDNTVLLAVGDFNVDELIKTISKYISFNKLSKKNCIKEIKKNTIEPIKDYYKVIKNKDVKQQYFGFGLKIKNDLQNYIEEKICLNVFLEYYFGKLGVFSFEFGYDFKVMVENCDDYTNVVVIGKNKNKMFDRRLYE